MEKITEDIQMVSVNAEAITAEIKWFTEVMDTRLASLLGTEKVGRNVFEIDPPDLTDDSSSYASIVNYYRFSFAERLALILSLIPHTKPEVLDKFFIKNGYERGFTEIGGILGLNHGGFIPTGETVMFLLSGSSLTTRIDLEFLFGPEHPFNLHNILQLGETKSGEPYLSGTLILSREYKELFTTGKYYRPVYSASFPARLITTPLEWTDLVLENSVYEEIQDILTWIKHEESLMNDWGLKKKLKRGYRCLFYGPPGTGKTLTATLLGKITNRDVYRVDLSMMISKYIGETEKNLSGLFDQAENKNWILFFDEADALFGKRVEGGSFNDRSANQQIAYLLQRLEDYNGVVVLASNFETSMDEAFTRRFESMIYFPLPAAEQRLRLWEQHFKNQYYRFEAPELLPRIAEEYAICGGKIDNVLRYCCVKAIGRNSMIIQKEDLLNGIRIEFSKEGKSISTIHI